MQIPACLSTFGRAVTTTALTLLLVSSFSSTSTNNTVVQAKRVCKIRERKAWSALSDTEQQDFLAAVKKLKLHDGNAVPAYNDFVAVHAQNARVTHSFGEYAPVFLLWHRYYIHRFEAALQHVSGDYCLTLPYWDWETDAANPAAASPLRAHTFGSVQGRVTDAPPGPKGLGSVTEGIADCGGFWDDTAAFGPDSCVQRYVSLLSFRLALLRGKRGCLLLTFLTRMKVFTHPARFSHL